VTTLDLDGTSKPITQAHMATFKLHVPYVSSYRRITYLNNMAKTKMLHYF